MNETLVNAVISVLIALLASSGFWAYISSYKDKRNMQTDLLIGLAHDRLVSLSLRYITRGWITQDEYENLSEYLYKPYKKLGGNGSVQRLMLEIDKLPIKKDKLFDKITGDTLP